MLGIYFPKPLVSIISNYAQYTMEEKLEMIVSDDSTNQEFLRLGEWRFEFFSFWEYRHIRIRRNANDQFGWAVTRNDLLEHFRIQQIPFYERTSRVSILMSDNELQDLHKYFEELYISWL